MSAPVGPVEENGANVESPVSGDSAQESPENPEWGSAWESLEKEPTLAPFLPRIKETLKPTFSKWDSDRQASQAKYEPYKSYVDQGVDPKLIEGSLRLYQVMDQNPRFIYDQLANHYGFTPAEAAAAVEEAQEALEEDGDVDPSINALQQQIEELRNERLQEQQERLNSQTASELDSGIKKILAAHSSSPQSYLPLDERVLLNMVSQELAVAEMTGQPYKYDLAKTYQKWVTDVNQYRAIPAPNQAPQLTPSGNSGLPVHTGSEPISQEILRGSKSARVAEVVKRYSGQR